MHRIATRIAGLAICASALTACASSNGETAAAPTTMSPSNSMATNVNDALTKAQSLRKSGDFQGAARILAQVMLAEPDDARVVGEYGKLLAQEGRSSDAVNFLNRALELQPNDWTLYSALGVSFDQLNDHVSARTAYEHALSLKPGEAAVLNNYAMSRLLAGDLNGARILMAKAQASGSTDPRIAQNLELVGTPAPAAAPTLAPAPVAVAATVPAPVKPNPQPAAKAPSRIVMQDVPVDPLAGPVGKHSGKLKKAPGSANHVADNTKPVKKAKPSNKIPSLRQTADATKP